MLVFVGAGNQSTQQKNPRGKARTNNNLNHMWARIDPQPHWWEASTFTTAPPCSQTP